jgi:NAD-dependent dihydropyrimidine dehydrogenase PreA subunit
VEISSEIIPGDKKSVDLITISWRVIEMPPEIDYEKCIACGDCRERCSEDVFFSQDSAGEQGELRPRVTYPEACYHCYLCASGCPVGAIAIRTPLVMHVPYK